MKYMINQISILRNQIAELPTKDRLRLIQSVVQDLAHESSDELDDSEEEEIAAILEERLSGPFQGVESVPTWAHNLRDRFRSKTETLVASTRHG